MQLIEIKNDLVRDLEELRFSEPVSYVYNPLVYAAEPHEEYLRRFGSGEKEIVFVGMNPGPWGMTQTGVPFGEVRHVKDWLGITGTVGHPPREHPKKKVDGFSCCRSEVSGMRLWGLIAETFSAPEEFFRRFFVANFCPLLFLDEGGRNLTPDKLRSEEVAAVIAVCNRALRRTIEALGARVVVGVGKFAEVQSRAALEGLPARITCILHPSPSNPAANRGWKSIVLAQFQEQNIDFHPGGES